MTHRGEALRFFSAFFPPSTVFCINIGDAELMSEANCLSAPLGHHNNQHLVGIHLICALTGKNMFEGVCERERDVLNVLNNTPAYVIDLIWTSGYGER